MGAFLVLLFSAIGLWSSGSAQYASFPHVIFADWQIENKMQYLAYTAPRRGIRVEGERDIRDERFTYKGHNYSFNCFPIFKEFRERVPAFEDCTHYYEFVAVYERMRYVQFSKCEDGKMFDPETKKCIPGMVNDCIKKLDNCLPTGTLKYIGASAPKNWLLGNGQNFHKKHINDNAFYIGMYHYHNNCFPIFLEKVVRKKIPDPLFCNRFYSYEKAVGSNESIIALKSCSGKSVFDPYERICLEVDEFPDDCRKNIPGCEDPIETGLIVSNKRTNVIRYSVTNDVIEYPGGVFVYGSNLYNEDCWPLTMNENNEVFTAPDPTNCHRYYEGFFDGRPILRKACKSAGLIFNPLKGKCEVNQIPTDCHSHHGCQKGAIMERLDLFE